MDEKEVIIEDKRYRIKRITLRDKIDIENDMFDTLGRLKYGTYKLSVVSKGLIGWEIKDNEGKILPITEQTILNNLDPVHFDLLAYHIISFNKLEVIEKKTSLL